MITKVQLVDNEFTLHADGKEAMKACEAAKLRRVADYLFPTKSGSYQLGKADYRVPNTEQGRIIVNRLTNIS